MPTQDPQTDPEDRVPAPSGNTPADAPAATCDIRLGAVRMVLYIPPRLRRIAVTLLASGAGLIGAITVHHPR